MPSFAAPTEQTPPSADEPLDGLDVLGAIAKQQNHRRVSRYIWWTLPLLPDRLTRNLWLLHP